MIEGFVDETGAIIVPIFVVGAPPDLAQTAMLDTGFNGTLTLPASVVRKLDLVQSGVVQSMLADGSIITALLFYADVSWHGAARTIEVQESEGPVLLGMNMLGGSRLLVDAIPDGRVEITALS